MNATPSRIDTVTLFRSGATVRRLAEVPCPQGQVPPEIELTGLPLALLEPTVRVRVTATRPTGVEVSAGAVRLGLFVPPRGAAPEAPAVEERRKAAQALELKRDALLALESEIALLQAIPVPPRPEGEEGKQPPPSPMTARLALEQLAEDGITARVEKVRALRDEERTLRDGLAKLDRALALASSSQRARPDEVSRSVAVRFLVPPGAKVEQLTVEVEYFVRAARWAPAYQCRMTRDCLKAELQLRALVWQRSGEDWGRAKLLLSTAMPLSWTELPELSALRIGKRQAPPPARAGFRPPPTGSEPLFVDFDAGRSTAQAQLPVIPTWQPPSLESLPEGPPALPTPQPGSFGMAADAESPSELAEESAADLDDDVQVQRSSSFELAKSVSAGPLGVGGARGMRPQAGMAMAPPSMQPMPPPPPAPASRSAAPKRAMKMAERSRDEGRADDAFEGGEPEPLAAESSLGYLQLQLGAPTDGGRRTKLFPIDARSAALASLRGRGATIDFDALSLLSAAALEGQRGPPPHPGLFDVGERGGQFDFVYRAEAAVDVPSDGSWHSVPVSQRTAESSVLYVAVPREDSHVYREAMVKNPLAAPMLRGPVDVYVADEYVLSTTLPLVPPGGEFKLGLGVEQAIKVARNTRFEERRSGEKVVATSDLQHDIEIELVNRLDREIRCEVRERIPQPAKDAEVVVEETNVTPAWAPYTQEERGAELEGGRRWTVSVPAGKSQKLAARYVVKVYANNELIGGNRREA